MGEKWGGFFFWFSKYIFLDWCKNRSMDFVGFLYFFLVFNNARGWFMSSRSFLDNLIKPCSDVQFSFIKYYKRED